MKKNLSGRKKRDPLKKTLILIFCGFILVFLLGLIARYHYFGNFPHFFAGDFKDFHDVSEE